MAADSGRVQFTCNGDQVDIEAGPGESLLSVLREQLGLTSVKDGCAPQGQCGCCTVLVDSEPRVACVTPVARVANRTVTTAEGLDPGVRDTLASAFVATGGSQCGFCTPGIVVRAAAIMAKGRGARGDVDRALAAHLCRCTGWNTVREAIEIAASGAGSAASTRETAPRARDLDAAGRRAGLEGGVAQRAGPGVPLGEGGFADDDAPRDALVAVPLPPGSSADAVEAAGLRWVVGETLVAARALAAKVQGRRTTIEVSPPLALPPLPAGGVRLATSWVEPAYLEPDASWCAPGGEPATPLANGGAFGAKSTSAAPVAARELADRFGRAVRVVYSREDCVRLGPKRPPISGSGVRHGDRLELALRAVLRDGRSGDVPAPRLPYRLGLDWSVEAAAAAGPPASPDLRAFPPAEWTVLAEGALAEAGVDRADLVESARAGAVLLDTCAAGPDGALAGARVRLDPSTGGLERVEVRVAAGDPLDDVVLRSYCIGAAHMALGWVLSEGLAVDPLTGEIHDLTIRSFGVIRAKDTPAIDVRVIDDPGPPQRASDAVFAAVAAAAWNAVTAVEGARPESFPATGTRAARGLRR